jgi:hypothetical protein
MLPVVQMAHPSAAQVPLSNSITKNSQWIALAILLIALISDSQINVACS